MARQIAATPPENGQAWRERSRVVLTPVAAPAILGWFTFAIAALLTGSHLAGWWGGEQTFVYLAPFLLFVGLGQLMAGMWGFRAREPVATAIHGTWSLLWLGLGLAYTLTAFEVLTVGALEMPLGFALLALGLVTIGSFVGAVYENPLLAVLLGAATLTGLIAGIGLMAEIGWLTQLGGWLMVIGAVLAWYFATAMLVAEVSGREPLPMGRYHMAADLPGERTAHAVAFSTGMPHWREMAESEQKAPSAS